MLVYLVLHYKNADVTENCIDALLKTEMQDAQIVVVDNASNNGSYEQLIRKYQNCEKIHLMTNESNLGYAAGNNVGFRYAKNELKADWIVLLNNDVTIEQTDFQNVLFDEYNKEPFYVAGPDIQTPEGGNQNPFRTECPNKMYVYKKLAHDYIVLFLMKIGLQQKLKKMLHYDGNTFVPNEISTIRDFKGVLHGSCLVFSPDYIHEFNGLYDGTFLYCEEEILCYILSRLSYKYSYLQAVRVTHRHSVTMKREIKDEDARKMQELSNRIVSYRKMKIIMNAKQNIGDYLK